MTTITTIGIDLAKNVLRIDRVDAEGKVITVSRRIPIPVVGFAIAALWIALGIWTHWSELRYASWRYHSIPDEFLYDTFIYPVMGVAIALIVLRLAKAGSLVLRSRSHRISAAAAAETTLKAEISGKRAFVAKLATICAFAEAFSSG